MKQQPALPDDICWDGVSEAVRALGLYGQSVCSIVMHATPVNTITVTRIVRDENGRGIPDGSGSLVTESKSYDIVTS